jgi:hypothetical protein
MEPIDLEKIILSDKKDIVCKLETVLTLRNSRFPYPPFRTYEVILSDAENIKIGSICEGGSSRYRDMITFAKPGQYKIKIKQGGTGRKCDEYKFYFIDVIVV